MSLLVAFRLTGVLREPTQETITVETVNWNMTRPTDPIHVVDERVKNLYTDGIVLVGLEARINLYLENSEFWAGFDVIEWSISVNASLAEGSVESLIVSFTGVDEYASLDISEDPDHFKLVDVKVVDIEDWEWTLGKDSYLKAVSANQPKHIYLQFRTAWMFVDQNDKNHNISIILELTYFTGTINRRVVMPIELGVLSR